MNNRETAAAPDVVQPMSIWKALIFTIIIVPVLFAVYLLFFDISPTTSVFGVVVDADTGTPLADVLIYSRWIGDKLGSKISGPELYGRCFGTSNEQGDFIIDGIVPGLNFPGLYWLARQEVEFHHPLYLSEVIIIKRDGLFLQGSNRRITLKKASKFINSEAELTRFFGSLKRAFGLDGNSLLKRARLEGVIIRYDFKSIIPDLDATVFSKYPSSNTTRFSWQGFKDQLRKVNNLR